MKLQNKLDKLRLKIGDLVFVDRLDETGIVMSEPYMATTGIMRVKVMLTDEGIEIPITLDGCHLISRPLGSTCQTTPFPDELLLKEGPNPQKISSENFPELSTLTIDEDVH